MCGIFAYYNYLCPKSQHDVIEILIQGLKRLEYRGYDSAGLAVDDKDNETLLYKSKGNVETLEKYVYEKYVMDNSVQYDVHLGIAHTRWATHGPPNYVNSHPHYSDKNMEFLVVHNGMLTNYLEIKKFLKKRGYQFESETDTEIIAVLCKYIYELHKDVGIEFLTIIKSVVMLLSGAGALVFKSKHYPNECIATRRGSPLIIGIKTDYPVRTILSTRIRDSDLSVEMMKDRKLYTEIQDTNDLDKVPNNESAEYIISSDVSAILEHTNKVLFVEDDDIVVIKNGRISICHVSSKLDTSIVTEREFITLQMELDEIMKGKYKYYMEKEIYEQPTSILDTMRGRVDFNTHCVTLGGLKSYIQDIKRCRRLIFIACGTSYNSAIATRRIVEELTELPVNVELASDFHDRETPIFRDDVCFFISQSGETADTLMALDYCKKRGALLVGLTNTVGSSVSRQTNCGIHLNAGIEIGVASTKAYTSQVISLVIFSLLMSDNCLNKIDRRIMIIDSLSDLSKNMVDALKLNDQIKDLAKILSVQKSILLFGRGYDYSTCLEGALKIKELSYIHCEAILTGELKHGSLALIDKDVLSIMIISQDTTFKKSINSLQQISSRGCKPIIFTSADDLSCLKDHAKFIIQIPKTVDCLQPVINIIPLQLLAFHMACYLGHNVDFPRNLAKSVTVA